MPRILRMRRRLVTRIPEYLSAWEAFRRSVEPVGWNAWLFRGQGGVWLEFVEGKAPNRASLETRGTPATTAAEARVARWGDVVDESWWDEVPPGGDRAAEKATGGGENVESYHPDG